MSDHPGEPIAPRRLTLPRVGVAVLVVFGFLPLANWIPGGHDAEFYPVSASEWASGSLLTLGIAGLALIFARRFGVWPSNVADRLAGYAEMKCWFTTALLVGGAFGLYVMIAQVVFSAKPLLIDEIVQVIQARTFAEGRLALPSPAAPEFFSALHIVDAGGRRFSQFPPGGPVMLLPGVLAGAPWLVGPAFGAAAAGVFWQLMRRVEARPTVAFGATVLFAVAPFAAFMAGSHMNHVPTLFWLCLALWSLVRLVRTDSPSLRHALLCGLSFGIMATIRPTDAAAFALPAGVWLLARAWRSPGCWPDVIAAGVGIAVPVAALLAFNAYTTGSPMLFGYELLWGRSHRLGFHSAPWGVTHTPSRGVELVNLYFLRLQSYLFETPLPSLVPCIFALALTPRVRGFDRYLLWASALLVVSYFAYWHDGFFLGPRFFYLLLPALVLWTARLPALVRDRLPRLRGADQFVLLTYATAGIVALAVSVPVRVRQYAGGFTSMRWDYPATAARAGVENALILVRESWGAQVIVRMWALGISHSEAETLYRGVDTCVLDLAVRRLEQGNERGPAAVVALRPLLRDSSRVVKSDVSPDRSERVLPGHAYDPSCVKRIVEDRSGFTFLVPILASHRGSNVYARDLHARDTLLLRVYAGRPVYVLRPSSSEVGAPLELRPFVLDSARADWQRSTDY